MAKKNNAAASVAAPAPVPSTASAAGTAPEQEQMGCLGAIVRILWLAIGSMVLVSLALLKIKSPGFSGKDIAFCLVPVAMIAVRWVDITRFNGKTSDGKPATLATLRSYAIKLVVASAVLWGLARLASGALH